jgi:uncharacterized protein YbaP (TraB family)
METVGAMTFTGVFLTLSTIDIAPEIFRYGLPLDMKISSEAVAAGKVTGGLEDPMSQITILEGFTKEEESDLLLKLVEGLEDAIENHQKMIDVYLAGDIDAMLQMMLEEFNPEDEVSKELWDRMLDRRNKVMAEGIHERITHNPDMVFFFAVGAAHYPGEMGVLKLLEDMGYTLTRLDGDDQAIVIADDSAMAPAAAR